MNLDLLRPYFPMYSNQDLIDMVHEVRALGPTAWQERLAKNERFREACTAPGATPESYDAFRVSEGCVSCLRTISRKWAEFQSNLEAGRLGDLALQQAAFP